MKLKTWMFCWSLVPLALPAAILFLGFLFDIQSVNIAGLIGYITLIPMFLTYSFMFCGVQYAAFIIIMWIYYWKKDSHVAHKFSYKMPVLFAPVAVLTAGFLPVENKIELYAYIAGLTLAVGYFYVLLYHLSTLSARKLGWIKDWHA